MLPEKVHKKGPSLYYVHRNKWTRLCRADDPPDVLYAALANALSPKHTLQGVMRDYMATQLSKLAWDTQKDYQRIIEGTLDPVFGHMHPDSLTSQMVARYLHNREADGHGPAGNREVSVLSSVMAHGMRIGLVAANPCYGVRRNREKPKTRYVTDAELRQALRKANPPLRYLLWVAYLTGLRQKDLMALDIEDITEDGILVEQSKDGKKLVIEASQSLSRALSRATDGRVAGPVFKPLRAPRWTKWGIQSAMARLNVPWTFHDLRAKAESDHKEGLGLMARYKRAKRVRAVK